MKVIKMSEVKGEINKRGFLAKTLVEHKNATVKNLIINAGDIIPNHKVDVDVFFYIIKGTGTIVIGGEEALVVEGDIVTCPQNVEMSVKANKGVELSFLNVKTPSLT